MIAGQRITIAQHDTMKTKRLVYICDWLPPDFGAVGQYAVLFARQWASEGWAVTLVGLTSGPSNRQAAEPIGDGSLEVIRIHRHTYEKQKFVARLVWTVVSNVLLLAAAFRAMRRADTVLFTGSPPLMVHFIAPLNLLLRKTLIYRITDFHPECLIAERGRSGLILWPAACVLPSSGDVVSMPSKCWASIRPGDLQRAELRRNASVSSATLPRSHSHPGLSLYRCRMSCAADAG